MNLKEMLIDLKKDPKKFSELLRRIEELENAGGGDHQQNIKKNSPTIVEIP